MAEPEPYQTKAGKRYKIQYRKPDRKLTTKRGFRTKRDAREWQAQNVVDISDGSYTSPTAGRVTFAQVGKDWLETKHNIQPKTKRAYEQALARIGKTGHIGETYVKDITAKLVRDWAKQATADFAARTVVNDHAVLHQVLKMAVTDKLIKSNPAVGVDLPKIVESEMVPLTVEQLYAMADAAGRYRPAVLTLGLAGLRWGELVGLQVRDVDVTQRHIHVRRQKYESGGELIDGLPKYGKKRFVPLIDALVPVIVPLLSGKRKTDLVFTTPSLTPLWVGNARRDWFDPAAEVIGVEGLTPHKLRHTYASLAIRSGANAKVLQQAMGHSSAKLTMDRYAEWFPDDMQSLALAMGGMVSAECSQNVVTGAVSGGVQVSNVVSLPGQR